MIRVHKCNKNHSTYSVLILSFSVQGIFIVVLILFIYTNV